MLTSVQVTPDHEKNCTCEVCQKPVSVKLSWGNPIMTRGHAEMLLELLKFLPIQENHEALRGYAEMKEILEIALKNEERVGGFTLTPIIN